jgi:hypothetical protein
MARATQTSETNGDARSPIRDSFQSKPMNLRDELVISSPRFLFFPGSYPFEFTFGTMKPGIHNLIYVHVQINKNITTSKLSKLNIAAIILQSEI